MAVSIQQFIEKATHTDFYLQWDSHHTISAKYSVVNTLHHRTRAVCSSPQLLQKEEEHLHRVLERCKCLLWALNRITLKIRAPVRNNYNKRGTNPSGSTTANNQEPHMVVPYTKGLCESLKKHAVNMEYKCSLEEAGQLEAS